MRFFRSLIEPGGRLLSRHLGHLCETLQSLGGRLREAIASSAGQSAAGIVREVVGNLLNHRDTDQPMGWHSRQQHRDPDDLWQDPREPEHRDWRDHRDDFSSDDEPWDPEPVDQLGSAPTRSSHWLTALAIGLQTAAWWLLQKSKRFPVLTALGSGVIATLIACGCGPLAVTAASLLSLLGLVQVGAELMPWFTSN